MALTGRADGPPLAAPAGVVTVLQDLGRRVAASSSRLGQPVELDTLALLGERAAINGFTRQGDRSCGGGTRLLPAADGWLAVCLARKDDVATVPAWLEVEDVWPDVVWDVVAATVATRPVNALVERGRLLGLALAGLPPPPTVDALALAPPAVGGLPVASSAIGDRTGAMKSLDDVVVVDLSSLWAGPLCTNVLQLAGAQIVKVEATRRPDGARAGPSHFFDLLNAGKRSVAVDFTTLEGRAALRRVIDTADVVVEASRPRALLQLGIDRDEVMDAGRVHVWVSMTGHGRAGDDANAIAFGDDAAVAGGLVAWDDAGPCFCGDAIADPAAGLTAAAAVLAALATRTRWTIDVVMRDVAAALATGDVLAVPDDIAVSEPRTRVVTGRAPALGADTGSVLAELGE